MFTVTFTGSNSPQEKMHTKFPGAVTRTEKEPTECSGIFTGSSSYLKNIQRVFTGIITGTEEVPTKFTDTVS